MATRVVPLLLPLLLLLLLAERSCAASPSPAETSAADPSLPDGLAELLLLTIGRVVRSSVSELDGRLADLQTQVTQLAVTLAGLQDQQEAQNATLQRQLHVLETGVASVQTQLEAVHAQLDGKLDDIRSQIGSRLDGGQTQQTRPDTKMERPQSQESMSESASRQTPARDCSDLPAGTASGVHQLLLPGLRETVPAFCDQQTDGGNWTVFQRRADVKPKQNFFLDWQAYKRGFGNVDAEFWWGLEYLFRTTSLLDRRYQLRIDMEDFNGEKRFAVYQDFSVSSEAFGYRLHVTNYSGNAGDSLIPFHNDKPFSTIDKDQDDLTSGSCAQQYKGGWWYAKCHEANLNGLYLGGSHKSYADGINWKTWKEYNYSLKSVEMKMRPKL